MKRRHRYVFLGGGTGLVAAFAALGATADLERHIPLFLGLYASAFVFYGLGTYALAALDGPRVLPFILTVAVLARVVLLPASPSLSTDAYRYLWEGRVIVAGHNPFALAPDAPELEGLRDDNYAPINHKHLSTIYPPFAQSIFAVAAWIHPSLLTLKLLFMLFDLATIFVLVGILRSFGRTPNDVGLYAWNPLVIFETAHSGHVDVVGLLFLMLGLYFLVGGRARWSAVALAVSFLAKFTSVLLAPFFARRKQLAPLLLIAVVIVLIGYVPYARAGSHLFTSLGVYGTEWHFNGLAFSLLSAVAGGTAARIVLALAALVFIAVYAWRETDPVRYTFLSIGTLLLLSPTLYPWYVVWIVPFAALTRNLPWILFTATVFASYWVWVAFESSGRWQVPDSVYGVEFLPVLLAYAYLRLTKQKGIS